MAGIRALPKRLLASVVLLAMAAVFAALAVFFAVKESNGQTSSAG